ncbi:cytochrome P450 [Trametes cingulata]|nr:cytochrome P450 [Trametes cingulata]
MPFQLITHVDSGLNVLTFYALLAVAVPIAYFVVVRRPSKSTPGSLLPPGPRGWPIIGCFAYLTKYPELALHRWAKTFGPFFSFTIGNQLFVVISDPQIVKDLIITNGAIFSSRKDMYMKAQLIFARRGITATPYNDTWRKHRRLAAMFLTPRAVEEDMPRLESEAREMIRDLYVRSKGGALPINPQPFLSRASLNNILSLVFGFRTESMDDNLVSESLRLSREFMNTTGPVSNLVDFVPLLQKLPNRMSTRGRKLHHDLIDIWGSLVRRVEDKVKRGEPHPDCMAKYLIEHREEEQLDDLDTIVLCCAFLIGGVETTSSIKQWFAAHIPACPEIQAKAQAELDSVCGRDRLPTVGDEAKMPYIHAIVKEVERCHNPFWLGTPHVNTEDFFYKGYLIPKGTVVVTNTWTMHHDPGRYPDPYEFKPERYLNNSLSCSESANLANPMERDHWMFGAGRRICPGIALGEREIFLAVSHLLWAYNMEELPDEPIDLKEYDGQSGRSPVPNRIRLTPRDEHVAAILGL